MRFGSVGPRGLALLVAAGFAGFLLAAHGWANRAAGGTAGPLGGGAAATQTGPVATPSTGAPPSTAPSGHAGAGPAAGVSGPLLNSQPFAPYAFAIWPGTPSTAAKAALTGLSVSVHRQTSGLSITAVVNGQKAGPAHFYSNGARVYVVESTMGDDSNASDYNLGDDGIVVTDAQGRIVS